MNPIIEKQLHKCTVAVIPPFDEDTTTIYIEKRTTQNKQTFIPGHYYEIELADYLVHPPADFSLHINWNRNVVPKCSSYRCEVLQTMGSMVKINGVGIEDESYSWEGWLPLEGIKVLKEI